MEQFLSRKIGFIILIEKKLSATNLYIALTLIKMHKNYYS
jgi:hypothetical protein